jgi:hypothetical protein
MTDQTATKPRVLTLSFDNNRVIKVAYEFENWKEDDYVLDAYAASFSQMIVNGLSESDDVDKQD